MIKHPPNFLFFYPFTLTFALLNKVGYGSALAVLHNDIDSDILFVDFEIEVFENVDVVHADESVDFLNYAFFLFRGDVGEGYFFNYDVFLC